MDACETGRQFGAFLPIMILCSIAGISSFYVAKGKGRNAVLWAALGLIPLFGFFSFTLLAGLPDLITRRQLDELNKHLSEIKK